MTGLAGMRLCIVFHEAEALGAGISVMRCLNDLAGYGWLASALFPRPGPLAAYADRFESVGTYPDRPLAYSRRGWKAPPGVGTRLARTPQYLRAVRRAFVKMRPHVVHANTLLSLPEALMAKTLGIPVVMHVHELPALGSKLDVTLRLASYASSVFVAVSDPVYAMVKRSCSQAPVVVVRNGVDSSKGARRERPSDSPFTVGTVGAISHRKGTDVFVDAARLALARRPSLRFEHVGPHGTSPDSGFSAQIMRKLLEPPLAEAISLLGAQPAHEALLRWDAFVLASRQDPFPLATLEAMAVGLPVVATDVGGLREQISHMDDGLIVPAENPRAIADRIVALHDDPGLRARLGSAAAARARSDFSLGAQAEGLHTAYIGALNLSHGPPAVRRKSLQSLNVGV